MCHIPPTDHSAPPGSLSLEAAHAVMREHIDCPVTICPIKRCAKATLIRHGHLQPAERTKFGF